MKSIITFRAFLLLLFALLFLSCNSEHPVDLESEKAKILDLHHAQRHYHFKKDSIAFADQLSDNFISVNRGIISKPEKGETISRYHGYFSSVEFLKWDDVSEPVIKFSDDGTMAYTIVDKIVAITSENEDGELTQSETHFAWTAIYRKYGDQWKIDCVTSTNKPETN
ncbi:nuclear transport factor 2 family protein [Winogradskyella tangerina]|uniref:nuclear transport factor 2 family protein n=1 Tax=Winogradskyella tangerina TaxID=2023240 RepID=UPI000DBE8873|nr:nuclear transport factor 2 family protein [Winogradskyella tangerina]